MKTDDYKKAAERLREFWKAYRKYNVRMETPNKAPNGNYRTYLELANLELKYCR